MADTVGMSLTIPFVFPVPETPSAPSGGGNNPTGGDFGMVPAPAPPAPPAPAGGDAGMLPAPPAFTPSEFFQPVTVDLTLPASSAAITTAPVQGMLYEDIFRSFGDDDKYFWWL
jgi:hypothetical protein